MDIKFTDGKHTEVVGDYTVTVWESGSVYAALTSDPYEDVADIGGTDDAALTFSVQDRERGTYADSPEARTIPLTVIRRLIELHDGVGK